MVHHGQTVAAQVATLTAAGAAKVFREVASGAKTDRAQLRRALEQLEAGDVLLVTRLDRLARSTFDLFAIVKQIVDAGGQFRSLAEPWADTSTSTGCLMIAVLGGLADVERDLITTRTAEGRSRAKTRGQHMGRPPKLTQQQEEARKRRAEGATLKELADSYNVGRATISRLDQQHSRKKLSEGEEAMRLAATVFLTIILTANTVWCQSVSNPTLRKWPISGDWYVILVRAHSLADRPACLMMTGYKSLDTPDYRIWGVHVSSNDLAIIANSKHQLGVAGPEIEVSVDNYVVGRFPVTDRPSGGGDVVTAVAPVMDVSSRTRFLSLIHAGSIIRTMNGQATFEATLDQSAAVTLKNVDKKRRFYPANFSGKFPCSGLCGGRIRAYT